MPAGFAALSTVDSRALLTGNLQHRQLIRTDRTSACAVGADPAHQPLGLNRQQAGTDQVPVHAHVLQAGNRTGSVIGVQGGKYQVSGERRLDGNLGGLVVANLAHHQHVRILTHNRAQPRRKTQSDAGVGLNLGDAIKLVFHRVFHGDDLLRLGVDLFQRRIQRCGLAATGRAGNQNHAVGLSNDPLVLFENTFGHAECGERYGGVAAIKNTQHHRFAVNAGQGGNPHVQLIAAQLIINAPVLRQALFANIKPRHQLQARGHGGMNFHRQLFNPGHDAVNPAAHIQGVLVRLKMNVAGIQIQRASEQVINQPDNGRV